MGIGYFATGQKILLDSAIYLIVTISDDSQVHLLSETTRRNRFVELEELINKYIVGEVEFVSRVQAVSGADSKCRDDHKLLCQLSEEEQNIAKIRYAYVKAIQNEKLKVLTPKTIQPVIDDVWDKLNRDGIKPHWNTVYRWVKRYENGACTISALFTRHKKKGNRIRRYQENLLKIVDDATQLYLTKERPTVSEVVGKAVNLVERENRCLPESLHLPLPTRSLVQKAIDDIPAYDRMVARYGVQAAKRAFRTVMSNITAERILERVEIDHTVLDVIVLDSESYMPLGRPTLTVCIDVKSRCVLGFYVGFEPPSFSTVAHCLQHAFMPKNYVKEKYASVVGEWSCYGVMEKLIVDNGLEFHSKGLESMCYEFNIDLHYMPRKTPWYKGIVERLIGTMNENVSHIIPGTTFSNIWTKGDYDASQNAVVVLSELEEILHKWVIDIYHNDIHQTIGKPPIVEWRKDMDSVDIALPHRVEDLGFMSAIPAKRRLSHKGIQINKLYYNSHELGQLRMIFGDVMDVEVRYSPANLGLIYVVEPDTGRPISVPAINSEYADGLTLWAHKVCEKHSKYYMSRSDIEALAEAKEVIRDMCQNALTNKKMKTRKAAKRFADATKGSVTADVVLSDIEYGLIQETDGLDLDDETMVAPTKLMARRVALGGSDA